MKMTPMKWFYSFLKKYRRKMALGLVFVTCVAVLAVVNPYISGIIVDNVIKGGGIRSAAKAFDLPWSA